MNILYKSKVLDFFHRRLLVMLTCSLIGLDGPGALFAEAETPVPQGDLIKVVDQSSDLSERGVVDGSVGVKKISRKPSKRLRELIDADYVDAIIRALRQQKSPVFYEFRFQSDKRLPNIENRIVREIILAVSKWIDEFTSFPKEQEKLEKAKEAFRARINTLEKVRTHYRSAQYGVSRIDLPKKIQKSPIIDGEHIEFDSKDLGDLVDLPSDLKSLREADRMLKIEYGHLAEVSSRLDELPLRQAVLYQRLNRLSRNRLYTTEELKDVAAQSPNDLVPKTRDALLEGFQMQVSKQIEDLFGPDPARSPQAQNDQLKRLLPSEFHLRAVSEAVEYEMSERQKILRSGIRRCREYVAVLRNAESYFNNGLSRIKDKFEIPAKIGIIVSGTLVISSSAIVVGKWMRDIPKSEAELAQEKEQAEKIQRDEMKAKELADIIDNAEDIKDFEGRMRIFAKKYYKDEAYDIVQEFRKGVRGNLDPLPGDIKAPPGKTPKYEAYFFDHANQFYENLKTAGDKVRPRLEGRARNAKSAAEIVEQANQFGFESTLPPLPKRSTVPPSN